MFVRKYVFYHLHVYMKHKYVQLIEYYFTSSEQYFIYIQDENKLNNI
jgi:hypothetical protein